MKSSRMTSSIIGTVETLYRSRVFMINFDEIRRGENWSLLWSIQYAHVIINEDSWLSSMRWADRLIEFEDYPLNTGIQSLANIHDCGESNERGDTGISVALYGIQALGQQNASVVEFNLVRKTKERCSMLSVEYTHSVPRRHADNMLIEWEGHK